MELLAILLVCAALLGSERARRIAPGDSLLSILAVSLIVGVMYVTGTLS